MHPGRVRRGCRTLTITHHPAEARTETANALGPEHILSSIKFSKCELQPHVSRIPIRRAGSTESPPAHDSTTSPGSINPVPSRDKEMSATMKVWKLLRPGLHRHLSLSGVSGKKEGAVQLASKALMKKSPDRSLHYTGTTIKETAQEKDETTVQQVEKTPAMPLPETVSMCETVTLCGEA